jgi:hypothetical protein
VKSYWARKLPPKSFKRHDRRQNVELLEGSGMAARFADSDRVPAGRPSLRITKGTVTLAELAMTFSGVCSTEAGSQTPFASGVGYLVDGVGG